MSSSEKKHNYAIRVDNVSKVYRIGLAQQRYDNIATAMLNAVRSPIKNLKKYRSLYRFTAEELAAIDRTEEADDLIWALRHVSFDIEQGEVVGIIGKNGAGKSTLLKLLTRITPPTIGTMTIKGRVSSLLEVGTGFHQELTGRENVYLNGTILGMRKQEVDRKFDEIVEFSGVSKFLDTPVKRYSSGMRVRLAFSVAAHLEPEILIIDEVLAVGDASFQQRCIDKMQDVGQHGRTVLFVSHNMPAVTMLCPRAILLQSGQIVADGKTQTVIDEYLSGGRQNTSSVSWDDPADCPSGSVARLRAVSVKDASGKLSDHFSVAEPVTVEMAYDVVEPGHVLMPRFRLHNEQGLHILTTIDQNNEWSNAARPTGRYRSSFTIPANFLSTGRISVTASLVTRVPDKLQFRAEGAVAFTMIDSMGPNTARGDWPGRFEGMVRPYFPWQTEFQPAAEPTAELALLNS